MREYYLALALNNLKESNLTVHELGSQTYPLTLEPSFGDMVTHVVISSEGDVVFEGSLQEVIVFACDLPVKEGQHSNIDKYYSGDP